MSLGRTQRVATSAGTFSFHRMAPEIFGGYTESALGVKLASAEKALFDVAYLSAGRSRLFTELPEVELPRGFRRAELAHWLTKILLSVLARSPPASSPSGRGASEATCHEGA